MSRVPELLKTFCLTTARACYSAIARQAVNENWSYEQYLEEVLRREDESRWQRRVERYQREAQLPAGKTLGHFDMARLPQRARQQFALLQTGHFLEHAENVLVFGNPGSGKTHLLCALGYELVRQGHRVLMRTCSLLIQELLIARRDLTLTRLLKRLASYEAIIVDDLGYVQQTRDEMEVLFTFLANRYEQGSLLLTSNLPFSQWESVFKDPMTTAAAIDRLVHHCVIIELNLPSYRMETAQHDLTRSLNDSPEPTNDNNSEK